MPRGYGQRPRVVTRQCRIVPSYCEGRVEQWWHCYTAETRWSGEETGTPVSHLRHVGLERGYALFFYSWAMLIWRQGWYDCFTVGTRYSGIMVENLTWHSRLNSYESCLSLFSAFFGCLFFFIYIPLHTSEHLFCFYIMSNPRKWASPSLNDCCVLKPLRQ